MALGRYVVNVSSAANVTIADPSVGMILNSSDMNATWWVELFVLFSNVSL
jgi:hypothetical protein